MVFGRNQREVSRRQKMQKGNYRKPFLFSTTLQFIKRKKYAGVISFLAKILNCIRATVIFDAAFGGLYFWCLKKGCLCKTSSLGIGRLFFFSETEEYAKKKSLNCSINIEDYRTDLSRDPARLKLPTRQWSQTRLFV